MVATQITLNKIQKEEKFNFSIPSVFSSFLLPKSLKIPSAFRQSDPQALVIS